MRSSLRTGFAGGSLANSLPGGGGDGSGLLGLAGDLGDKGDDNGDGVPTIYMQSEYQLSVKRWQHCLISQWELGIE